MATRIPKTIDGWNSRPTLEVLAEFESHDGDRIKVVSGWEKRSFWFVPTNPRSSYFMSDVSVLNQPYFSTKVYVNRQLAAEYSATDLPEDWVIFADVELKALARERAGAEEVIGLIDHVIRSVSERHDRMRETAQLAFPVRIGDEPEITDDFWDYFSPLYLDRTNK